MCTFTVVCHATELLFWIAKSRSISGRKISRRRTHSISFTGIGLLILISYIYLIAKFALLGNELNASNEPKADNLLHQEKGGYLAESDITSELKRFKPVVSHIFDYPGPIKGETPYGTHAIIYSICSKGIIAFFDKFKNEKKLA